MYNAVISKHMSSRAKKRAKKALEMKKQKKAFNAKIKVEGSEQKNSGKISNKVVPVNDDGESDARIVVMASKRRLKDPEKWSGFAKKYLLFSVEIERVTLSNWFSLFIIGVILVAGVLVGIQTYPFAEDEGSAQVLGAIDNVILTIFIIEVLLKMLAEGFEPWRYFTGPEKAWNIFDFTIVFFCLDIGIISSEDSGSVALLRLFRLARIAKLVRKIPQLQVIIMGLFGGLKSIGYILLLMLLVFYLFAIAGIFAFKTNDPFHFGSVKRAMVTMFRMSTLEDWTDVMYINYLGCYGGMNRSQDQTLIFHSSFYTDEDILFRNSETVYFCNATTVDEGSVPKGVTLFFFVFFILISALVILSLFIGAVTMSMSESMESMRDMKSQSKKVREIEKAALIQRKSTARDLILSGSRNEDTNFSPAERRKQKIMKRIMREAFKKDGGDFETEINTMRTRRISKLDQAKGLYSRFSDKCYTISESKAFDKLIMVVIIWAGIMVGISTESEFSEEHKGVLGAIETIILWIFIFEALIKIGAQDLQPWKYLYDTDTRKWNGWNMFDFLVILGSVIPIGSGQDIVVVLRLLRLLRVLKLVKSVPKLQIIVVALVNGLGSIGYIALILFMVFYMFGILGMILFQDNDPIHFGGLATTIITLFRCSTLEDWTDVMYINAYGCRYYGYIGYEDLCFNPDGKSDLVSFAYFMIFTVIGAFVLMTLFIGVVTTSMDEAREEQNEAKKSKQLASQKMSEMGVSSHVFEGYEQCFELLDVDESGYLEVHEILLGLSSIGIKTSAAHMIRLIEQLTGSLSGDMDFNEFCVFMEKMRERARDDQVVGQRGTKILEPTEEGTDKDKNGDSDVRATGNDHKGV
eukprot:g598.t1